MLKKNNLYGFIFSHLISLIGSKVSQVSISFWIYKESHSIYSFSIFLLLSFLPNVLGTLIAGPLSEKVNLKKAFFINDISSATIMMVLALFLYKGNFFNFYLLYSLTALLALISGLQWVFLQSYLSSICIGNELIKVNAWLSNGVAFSSLLAYPIAGLIDTDNAMKSILLIDTFTYFLSSIFVLKFLNATYLSRNNSKSSFLEDFKGGLVYIFNDKSLIGLMKVFFVFSFFSSINSNLLTPLLIEIYSSKYVGYILSLIGLGSIFASFLQILLPNILRIFLKRLNFLIFFIFFVNIFFVFLIKTYFVGILLFFIGMLIVFINSLTLIIIQEKVLSNFRGRVLSLYRSLSWISIPLGQLFCAFCVDKIFSNLFTSKTYFLSVVFFIVNTIAILMTSFFFHIKKEHF